MDAITYSYARQNMAEVMRRVCDDGETIVITSPRRKVVMISLDEYNAMTEVVSCRCHSIKNFTERRLRGAEHAGTEDARV